MDPAVYPPPMPFYESPEDHARRMTLIVTTTVMTVIASVFVGTRTISRFVLIRKPGVDDWFILCALFFTIGYAVVMWRCHINMLGIPALMLSIEQIVALVKLAFVTEVIYYCVVYFIKASIVFTYLRFAFTPGFRALCIATIVIHSSVFVICIFVTCFQCQGSLDIMWDLMNRKPDSCLDLTPFFYFTTAFNIATDIWILVLPIKALHMRRRPNHERVALVFAFGAGFISTVASAVRLYYLHISFAPGTDLFRDGLDLHMWSINELTIGLCCASVSAFKPVWACVARGGRGPGSGQPSPTGGPSPERSEGSSGRRRRGEWQQFGFGTTTKDSIHSRDCELGWEMKEPMPPKPGGESSGTKSEGVEVVVDTPLSVHLSETTRSNSRDTNDDIHSISSHGQAPYTPLSPPSKVRRA